MPAHHTSPAQTAWIQIGKDVETKKTWQVICEVSVSHWYVVIEEPVQEVDLTPFAAPEDVT